MDHQTILKYGRWFMNYIKLWNIDHQTLLSVDYGSSNYNIYGLWIPNYIISKLSYLCIMDHQTILN